MSSLKEWALHYVDRGLPIIPLNGKIPRVAWSAYKDSCPSREQVEQWWTEYPNSNIGLVTGETFNRFVLDIDGEEGQKSCEGFCIPTTVSVKTRRGLQHHFAYPRGFTGKTTIAGLLLGTDTRGNGGIVVLPPSLYSDSSGRYEWINDLEIPLAECPAWLLELLEKANKPLVREGSSDSWLKEKLDSLTLGNRNQTFTSIAGSLRSRGYNTGDIFELLELYADKVNFPLDELKTICDSVGSYQPREQVNSEAQSVSDFLADEQKVEWIVPGIIAKRSIGFIAGLPETNKTWCMMDLAIEVAKGGGLWLGKFPVNGGKVLFVDQERFRGETQRRLKKLLSGTGVLPGSLATSLTVKSGTTVRLNMQHSFEAFRRELLEIKPDLVIVDSFATFHTSSENDRTEIQKVLELIKQLRTEIGCTFMFINHEGKGVLHHEPGEVKTPNAADMMGSIGVPAAAEVVFSVRRKDEESCMCYVTKNTLAQKVEPFSVSVVDVPEGIKVVGS